MTYRKVSNYVSKHAVRLYGVVVSLLALVAFYVPALPSDLVLGLVGAVLTLVGGEAVQRIENRKSREALEYGRDEALDAL